MNAFVVDAHQRCEILLKTLQAQRKVLGYTQAELAENSSVSRQTVIRAEALNPSVLLNNFVQMASALGLSLRIEHQGVADASQAEQTLKSDAGIVHRGFYPLRADTEGEYADQRREGIFARMWSEENSNDSKLLEELLAPAVRTTTQDHASAAATIVQWLGSEVGFNFLKEAMQKSGYEIVEKKKHKN